MKNTGISDTAGRKVSPLVEAADLLFRNSRFLAVAGTVITLSALLYVAASPSEYKAEALLLLRNDRSAASVSTAPPVPITESEVRTEVELLLSRDVLENTARAAGLIAKDNKVRMEMDTVLDRVRASLRVTAIPKSDMIRLEYTSTNRWEGSHFLTELARVHQDRYVSLRTGSKLKMFEEEADRLNAELKEKRRELAEFQRAGDIHSITEQKTLLLEKIASAEAKLHDLELMRADGQQRVAQIESLLAKLPQRLTTEVRKVPNQYSTERLRTMLVELENRKADPEQIERTRRALAASEGSQAVEEATNVNPNRQTMEQDLVRAQMEVTSAVTRMSKLRGQAAQYRTELDRLEASAAEHETLSREIKELEDRYELNSHKAEEVRIHTALDDRRITNVVMAQEPQVPTRAEMRPYWFALAAWMTLMLISVFLVLKFSPMRRIFYTPGVLEDFAGVPVLGTVPLERRLIG